MNPHGVLPQRILSPPRLPFRHPGRLDYDIRGKGGAMGRPWWYEKEKKRRWRPSRELWFWVVLLLVILLVALARTCSRG